MFFGLVSIAQIFGFFSYNTYMSRSLMKYYFRFFIMCIADVEQNDTADADDITRNLIVC